MAPSKIITEHQQKLQQREVVSSVITKISGRICTRSQALTKAPFENKFTVKDISKRKADQLSPPKGKMTKRTALTDININATNKANVNDKGGKLNSKKVPLATNNVKQKELVKISTTSQTKVATLVNLKPSITTANAQKCNKSENIENVDPNAKVKVTKEPVVVVTKVEAEPVKDQENRFEGVKSIKEITLSGNKSKFRRTLESCHDKSDDSSLYSSAVEDMSQCDESLKILTPVKKAEEKDGKLDSPVVPEGVVDYDKANLQDPCQVSNYAMDIFNYMKSREKYFKVQDYMPRQVVITKWMRSLLVDWMVEVQENFELNHETLYLGVKITDIYLNKVVVAKEILQLVGAAALFIAAKYDERVPPQIEDFVYLCENAFTREDIIKMEINVFKVIEFNLGMPLSYRFLRRFARCCQATMVTLTLARYILELSLMEYHLIFASESKVACAALYIALKMKGVSGWTPTLEYYSGYKLSDFKGLVLDLNAMLHSKPREQLTRVRNKYSHKIFFHVAKTPLLDDNELFDDGEKSCSDKPSKSTTTTTSTDG